MALKSGQEKERLLLAAKAQSVLMQVAVKTSIPLTTKQTGGAINEVYEPEGEIDYTKYNKAKK